jgi:hypothetical protein
MTLSAGKMPAVRDRLEADPPQTTGDRNHQECTCRPGGNRSLDLATAVAIVIYKAVRQQDRLVTRPARNAWRSPRSKIGLTVI